MTALSVNLNKIALLRNSRGRNYPNIEVFAEKVIALGADGLTIHPRPDQRHATYADISSLKQIAEKYPFVELNIEGYPSETLIHHCLDEKVDQVTLVPDLPDQLTSDHGWSIQKDYGLLTEVLAELKQNNIRSSLFMDTDLSEIEQAAKVGADRIELHTESYARAFEQNKQHIIVDQFVQAYQYAKQCGMGVNAGHDLDLENLSFFLENIPVDEVSIGHALTIESIELGIDQVVKKYAQICHQ